jgi:hypothetical protein
MATTSARERAPYTLTPYRRLRRILGGQDQIRDSHVARADGYGKGSADRTHCAIKRQFADQDMMLEGLDNAHCAENSEGHRQVEPRALLANIGGGQIDGERLVRVPETGVHQGGLDALAALTHGYIGHSYSNGVARRARLVHVDFDIDQMGVYRSG